MVRIDRFPHDPAHATPKLTEAAWSIVLPPGQSAQASGMLYHVLDRARRVSGAERVVTIADGDPHELRLAGPAGRLIASPRDCGTAPAAFLAATYVLVADPDATLVVIPPDHAAGPEALFVDHLRAACHLAQHDNRLIVLAAVPRSAQTVRAWVLAAGSRFAAPEGCAVLTRAIGFQEGPDCSETLRVRRRGALWNTGIVAAKVKSLWALGWLLLPEMMRRLEHLRQVLHGIREGRLLRSLEPLTLANIYQGLEPADLFRHVLARSIDSVSLLVMNGVDWTEGIGSRGPGRSSARDRVARPSG